MAAILQSNNQVVACAAEIDQGAGRSHGWIKTEANAATRHDSTVQIRVDASGFQLTAAPNQPPPKYLRATFCPQSRPQPSGAAPRQWSRSLIMPEPTAATAPQV